MTVPGSSCAIRARRYPTGGLPLRLDRARRGGSGALHSQSALARLNSRSRGLAPGSVRRPKASISRSRAVDAREPGQVREEAALSDTVHAPRGSREGADGRRARPEPFFNGGCTVHFFLALRARGDVRVLGYWD